MASWMPVDRVARERGWTVMKLPERSNASTPADGPTDRRAEAQVDHRLHRRQIVLDGIGGDGW
jgi:hypothetical protein